MTTALIGMRDNGHIISALIRNNGSPRHAGNILNNHYANEDDIRRLITPGDMKEIGYAPDRVLGKKYANYDERKNPDATIHDDNGHAPHSDDDTTAFLARAYMDGAEYAYLYDDGEWWAYSAWEFDHAAASRAEGMCDPTGQEFATLSHDVAGHGGHASECYDILVLRELTGIPVDYGMYRRLNEGIRDLKGVCLDLLDGEDNGGRWRIIQEIIRWHEAEAWHEGAVFGASTASGVPRGEGGRYICDKRDNPYRR